ncbi:hypothetical protein [Tenacibaculum sp. 190524A05c]|uniref:hypothetical protein n=1 Tax=Tenacibaculum platacis TaxID=3137852 RepID=UPI0031FA7484
MKKIILILFFSIFLYNCSRNSTQKENIRNEKVRDTILVYKDYTSAGSSKNPPSSELQNFQIAIEKPNRVSDITRIKKENKKYVDTISIDYLKHQKILDILKLLPKQTMISWEWTQEDRIKTVDFIEKNNFLIDSTKRFNNITYIKPNTLGIQVVDGFWTLSIYQLTSAKTLIITNDIVGDGKDINSFLFTENSFEKIEFNQLFGKGIKNLIKNQSEQCVLELEDNYFTFDYDFTDKNIVTFTSWGLEKDEQQNCFKGNVLEFELNTSEEKFELKSMFWKEN